MSIHLNFYDQFTCEPHFWEENLDFVNWFRYYYLVKSVLNLKRKTILEVGVGSGMVRNCLTPLVSEYKVFDINPKLKPDYVGDIRKSRNELNERFDCVIVADVLEHIPFEDLPNTVQNILGYLTSGGNALITIPHRQSNFLFMSPKQIPHVFTVPTGFLSFGAFWRRFIKRKIWIDPNHLWEIGDGNIEVKDVTKIFSRVGFEIVSFEKLLYVDYWVLKKL